MQHREREKKVERDKKCQDVRDVAAIWYRRRRGHAMVEWNCGNHCCERRHIARLLTTRFVNDGQAPCNSLDALIEEEIVTSASIQKPRYACLRVGVQTFLGALDLFWADRSTITFPQVAKKGGLARASQACIFNPRMDV